jgi:hypothetical protein
VPQVGVGIVVGQSESDQNPLPDPVGLPAGILERMVELRTLRLLHPVENVASLNDLTVVQMPNARVMNAG